MRNGGLFHRSLICGFDVEEKVRIFQNEHNDPTVSQLRQYNRRPSCNVELRRGHSPLPGSPFPILGSSITTIAFLTPPALTSNF